MQLKRLLFEEFLFDFAQGFRSVLPRSIGLAQELRVLKMKNLPTLYGAVPQELARCAKLTHIELYASFSGKLPTWREASGVHVCEFGRDLFCCEHKQLPRACRSSTRCSARQCEGNELKGSKWRRRSGGVGGALRIDWSDESLLLNEVLFSCDSLRNLQAPRAPLAHGAFKSVYESRIDLTSDVRKILKMDKVATEDEDEVGEANDGVESMSIILKEMVNVSSLSRVAIERHKVDALSDERECVALEGDAWRVCAQRAMRTAFTRDGIKEVGFRWGLVSALRLSLLNEEKERRKNNALPLINSARNEIDSTSSDIIFIDFNDTLGRNDKSLHIVANYFGGCLAHRTQLTEGAFLQPPFRAPSSQQRLAASVEQSAILIQEGPLLPLITLCIGNQSDALALDNEAFFSSQRSLHYRRQLGWHAMLHIVQNLLSVLAAFDSRGLIHCDFGPRQVALDEFLNTKIIDFVKKRKLN